MLLFARPTWHHQASRDARLTEKSKQELLDLENHWLQVENDPDALESILAPDFLHVVPMGFITKEEQLNFMRKRPAPEQRSERHFEDMHVRVYGSVGIVNGMLWRLGRLGERRYSPTYLPTVMASGRQ
jgi:hypothetical protein